MPTLIESISNKSLQNLIKINAEIVRREAGKKASKR